MITFLVASGVIFWLLFGIVFTLLTVAMVSGVRTLRAQQRAQFKEIEDFLRTEADK